MSEDFYKLTLVTNRQNIPLDKYLHFIDQCAQSGITAVQLREKKLNYAELLEFGKQLQNVLPPYNIPLIINDNVELAFELNADGVHLGQSDGNILKVSELLGANKIIGITIDSIEQLLIVANTLPMDYVGVGAIFPKNNKSNVATVWGCEGLKRLAALTSHLIIAIGVFHNDMQNPKIMTQQLRQKIEAS